MKRAGALANCPVFLAELWVGVVERLGDGRKGHQDRDSCLF